MSTVIIASLAVACVLVAVEAFVISLGKFRGLVAIAIAILSLINLSCPWKYLDIYTLAVTFLGLSLSMVVEQLFNTAAKDLPKRIPPR